MFEYIDYAFTLDRGMLVLSLKLYQFIYPSFLGVSSLTPKNCSFDGGNYSYSKIPVRACKCLKITDAVDTKLLGPISTQHYSFGETMHLIYQT